MYKDQIIKLRSEGYSYREIARKLKCAKSTVARYSNSNNEEKAKEWKKENSDRDKVYHKIDNFHNNRHKDKEIKPEEETEPKTSVSTRVNQKIQGFVGNKQGRGRRYKMLKRTPSTFGIKDIEIKFNDTGECYLSGRKLDWEKTTEWHLDHIVARSKGGSNTLDNCGIACKEANLAKSNLDIGELLELCEDILTHNGATVKW